VSTAGWQSSAAVMRSVQWSYADVTIFEDHALERNTVIAPASAIESGGIGVPASLDLMIVDAAPCASACTYMR